MENEEKKKDNIVLSVIANIVFWIVILLFLEISYRFSMKYNFELESLINILLYSTSLGAVLSIVSRIFNDKVNNIITSIILLVIGVMFSVQCVFSNIFKAPFAISNLALGDQVASFMKEAIEGILNNIGFIIIFLAPFILFLIFKKKIKLKKNTLAHYITYIILFAVFIAIFFVHINSTKGITNSTYELYYKVNEVSLNLEKLGVLNTYRLDIIRNIFGFEQKLENEYIQAFSEETEENFRGEPTLYEYNTIDLNFEKATSNSSIKQINEYIQADVGTKQNEYTGMFKDYNLIYITAESFYEIAIDEELTPTLYKMTHSGFVFENYYTPNVLSTIGGEFQSLTGLYPDSSILSTWRTGKNYFPYGLGTVFNDLGYNTYAYHNHYYTFQDRNKYLVSQGFTNFLARGNGLQKRMNCDMWPESDDEMMRVTLPDYINSEEPFLAYYMTVSGHMNYNFTGGNAMSLKHKDEVQNLNATTEAKAYVATQIELDKALERLVNELKQAGKLDKTVFVLLADHYPYALSQEAVDSLSTYKRDNVVEINHNALIIWNSKMEEINITKACMSADVLPTILNLFGVNYDSRLFTGRDILSTSEGIAIMRNLSWVTEKGTYFASSGKFEPKEEIEISEDYVENINNIVKNRLNISKLIMKTNYYDYLFK